MSAPPPYTKTEIERRWLTSTEIELCALADREREIEDRYVLGTRLRLRKVTESGCTPIFKLGKKYEPETAAAHHVVSTYLSQAEYEVLSSLPSRVARKRRLSVNGGALDVYEYPNQGLRVFEVEFASLEQAAAYIPPAGLGREVTGDPAYSGYALASAA